MADQATTAANILAILTSNQSELDSDTAKTALANALAAAIFDAELGGGGLPQFYTSGTYNTMFMSTGITYGAISTTILYYQHFYVHTEVSISKLRYLTNSTAAGTISFTLYTSNAGAPDQKIIEVTGNTATAAGSQVLTFASQTLQPGLYFWAIQSSAAIQLWYTNRDDREHSYLGRNTSNQSITQKYKSGHSFTSPTPTTAIAPNNDYYGPAATFHFVQNYID